MRERGWREKSASEERSFFRRQQKRHASSAKRIKAPPTAPPMAALRVVELDESPLSALLERLVGMIRVLWKVRGEDMRKFEEKMAYRGQVAVGSESREGCDGSFIRAGIRRADCSGSKVV